MWSASFACFNGGLPTSLQLKGAQLARLFDAMRLDKKSAPVNQICPRTENGKAVWGKGDKGSD